MDCKEIITKGNGNWAVVINSKDGYIVANLYIRDLRAGIMWVGKARGAARRWAGRQLAAKALLK